MRRSGTASQLLAAAKPMNSLRRAMSKTTGRIFKEGLIGGLIAYAAIVLALGTANAVQGRSVFQATAAMGAVLFHGAEASSRFAVEPGFVLAY